MSERAKTTPNPALPRVEERLGALSSALTRLVWVHGLSSALGAAALWMLVTFALDWWLHLPLAVRLLHLALLAALVGWLVWRELLRPLRARPDRAGLAVLYERAQPELREVVVSAVELPAEDAGALELEARQAIWRAAEAQAPRLDPRRALDPRAPRRRLALGSVCCVGLGLACAAAPDAARIYLERLLGGSTPWPQRTHLAIEVPSSDPAHPEVLAQETGVLHVRVPKGSDLPILVRARGSVPEEITLHLSKGGELVVSSSGGDSFRTFLRALAEDVTLHASGGDDDDEDPRLEVEVLEPPDVLAVAVSVVPPAYSKLPARTVFEPEVEVLAGSRLSIALQTRPADVNGHVQLLPEDRQLELAARPFPAREPGAAPATGLGFELEALRSLRYRVLLSDRNGLSNPEPGLYAITVVADRPPEIELLSPARGELDTVTAGWVALRMRIEDDFGLSRLSWSAVPAGAEPDASADEHELVWRELGPEERGEPGAKRARLTAYSRARLTVAELAGAGNVVEGAQFRVQVRALDDCQPTPHEGRSFPIQLRVLSGDEFLRRVQDRLNRAQLSTRALAELARDKLREARELVALFASDAPELKDGARETAALATGLRRVQGDARALSRELVNLVEAVLYARIDERSQAALEAIDQRLSASTARGFDPEPWRDLYAARRRGEIAAGTLAAKLVEVAGLALEVSEDDARAAAEQSQRAQQAERVDAMHAALAEATQAEGNALSKLEHLSELLAEWDNFQTVLNLTRDILSGQKTLNERTSRYAKEH